MSVFWPPLSSQAAWKVAVPAPELTGVSPNRLAPSSSSSWLPMRALQ